MPTRTQIQNWGHAAVLVLGVLSAVYGAFTLALHQSGLAIDTQWSGYFLAIGSGLAILSKGIDSLNAALLGILPGSKPAPVPAPNPPAAG
jgi:hypothetical protein